MFISGSPTVLRLPSSTCTSSEYDPFSPGSICTNLTGAMDFDGEIKRRRHRAICVAYNPTSTLLAIATPTRLRVLWGKASNHVLLGDVEERFGKLEGGPSLLWKHNSSCIAAVSSEGRLLIYAVKQVVESQPLNAGFATPDWIEHVEMQYEGETSHVNMETDGQESDAENWMEPRKALLKPYPPVILESSITALCAGKFGRSILVGTYIGGIAKISWLGEVLQLFRVMDSLPRHLSVSRSYSESDVYDDRQVHSIWSTTNCCTPCAAMGLGVKSITFNNSLQMLAMVRLQDQKVHGSLYLGVLCGDTCFIRGVTITESDAEKTAKGTRSPYQRARKGFEQGSSSMSHQSEVLTPPAVSVTHVVFSSTASLLGVCLLDGTVLVSRVEQYRTGSRSERQLFIRRMSTDSYTLSPSGVLDSAVNTANLDEDINTEDVTTESIREGKMASLWGYEVQHLLCLSHGDNLHDFPRRHSVPPVQQPVSSLCFSPDASAVAVAQGVSLMIWSTVDGKQMSNTSSNDDEIHNNSGSHVVYDSKHVIQQQKQPENGPFCSLSWGYCGYRIIAAPDHLEYSEHFKTSHDSDSSSTDTIIIAFDIISPAASELSSAQLCFRSHDHVIILDTLPWEPKMRYWRTLPVHQGYIAANGPVKHASTSPSGAQIAVAGSHGLSIYNRAQSRWRVFSSIQQERETIVSGMCWWGEEAVFVICRQASGYELRLYLRHHLSVHSELRKPLRLPPGLKPAFMSCINEGRGESAWLLIGGSRDCFVCHFMARTNLLKASGTDSVYLSASYEASLPHVLDEGALEPSYLSSNTVMPPIGAPRRMFLVPHVSPPCVAILDFCGTLAVMSLSRERAGSRPSNGAIDLENTTPVRFLESPPIEVIKRGVVSMVDLSSLVHGKLFGTNNNHHYDNNALYPCYLLRFHDVGDEYDQQHISAKKTATNNGLQDTLWCPALNLKPLTQQQQYQFGNREPALHGDMVVPVHSPILGLDQVGFLPVFGLLPDDVNMGLVPSLGSTVHVSQAMHKSIDEPTRFSLRTIIYPSLYIILRHLIVLERLQLQQQGFSDQEMPHINAGHVRSIMQILASHMNRGFEENSSSNNIISEEELLSDTFCIAALLIRKLVIAYPGCIPETLEILLRHVLERSHSAHSRQRRRESSQAKKIFEEEEGRIESSLPHWILFDAIQLSQVVPECFLEVLARVARKGEPELESFLFPIHLIAAPSELLLGNINHEHIKVDRCLQAYPAHLVHECIVLNRLETATWYLPLIRDDIVLGLVEAGNIEYLLGNIIPSDMFPLTISGQNGWHHGLSHALSCCLFSALMEKGTTSDALALRLLPEIWLFTRKRERSVGVSTPTKTKTKSSSFQSPGPTIQHDKMTASSLQRSEGSSGSWIGWLLGTSSPVQQPTHPVTPLTDNRAINEAAASRCRLPEEESNNRDEIFCGSSDGALKYLKRESTATELGNAVNRARELYSMLPSDAAAVLSRFLWSRLATPDVFAVMAVFSSLTRGEISQDTGIVEATVLSSLRQPPEAAVAAYHRSSIESDSNSNASPLMTFFLSCIKACKLTPREAMMISAGSEEMLMLEQLWRISNALCHYESIIVCSLLLGKAKTLSTTFSNSPRSIKAEYPAFLLSVKSCIEDGTETEESILCDAVAKRLAELLQLASRATMS